MPIRYQEKVLEVGGGVFGGGMLPEANTVDLRDPVNMATVKLSEDKKFFDLDANGLETYSKRSVSVLSSQSIMYLDQI